MNRENYQKLKQIFQSALDIPSEKRAEFIDVVCRDDADLRRELELLLNSHDTGYLEEPAINRMAEVFLGEELEVARNVGHYRILTKIGALGNGRGLYCTRFKA